MLPGRLLECPSCYQRLEFVGDAVLDHLITKHLFFMYTDLPPGRLTDLQAAAVNNENFARVAVKHNLHLHLRHGSSALEKQIRDFVKEGESELSNPGFNSFVKLRKFLVTLLNLLLVLSSWIVDGTHQLCGRYSNPCCNQW